MVVFTARNHCKTNLGGPKKGLVLNLISKPSLKHTSSLFFYYYFFNWSHRGVGLSLSAKKAKLKIIRGNVFSKCKSDTRLSKQEENWEFGSEGAGEPDLVHRSRKNTIQSSIIFYNLYVTTRVRYQTLIAVRITAKIERKLLITHFV